MRGLIVGLIGLGVGVYVLASLLPSAVVLLNSTYWTGSSTTVITIGSVVLPIVVIASAIFMFLKSR